MEEKITGFVLADGYNYIVFTNERIIFITLRIREVLRFDGFELFRKLNYNLISAPEILNSKFQKIIIPKTELEKIELRKAGIFRAAKVILHGEENYEYAMSKFFFDSFCRQLGRFGLLDTSIQSDPVELKKYVFEIIGGIIYTEGLNGLVQIFIKSSALTKLENALIAILCFGIGSYFFYKGSKVQK